MTASPIERALRSARRRLAAQMLLDSLAVGWAIALAIGLVWLLIEPGRRSISIAFLLLATLVAIARTLREYPARLSAALELDCRYGLRERLTAAVGLSPEQRESPAALAVVADAEQHACGLRMREKFPLRLRRTAALVPLLGGLLALLAFGWNPLSDLGLIAPEEIKVGDSAKKLSDNPLSPDRPVPPPNPNAPDRSVAERLAALREDLDRLEREAREKPGARNHTAELTAIEDAVRSVERESLDRLAQMEEQLKQLEKLEELSKFEDGPARDAARSLAAGDLAKAEKALEELAKSLAEKPDDPKLREQLEALKNEIREAAENAEARKRLEELIEQARKEGRDIEGLQKELERLLADGKKSKRLGEFAEKLDGALLQLQKGDPGEAAKELDDAIAVLKALEKDAKDAKDAQALLMRLEHLKADGALAGNLPGIGRSNRPREGGENQGGQAGGGDDLSDPRPPGTFTKNDPLREVRPRVPFVDPKGAMTPAGSGGFGGGYKPADPKQLGPAIQRAAQTAAPSVAGQPIGPDDKAAVREFFERLGK